MNEFEIAAAFVAGLCNETGKTPYLVGFLRGLSKAAKRREYDTRDAFIAHCNELERGFLAGAAGDFDDLVASVDTLSPEASGRLREHLALKEIRSLAAPLKSPTQPRPELALMNKTPDMFGGRDHPVEYEYRYNVTIQASACVSIFAGSRSEADALFRPLIDGPTVRLETVTPCDEQNAEVCGLHAYLFFTDDERPEANSGHEINIWET